jgi:transcriptional regulator with XRE-family HTH domain
MTPRTPDEDEPQYSPSLAHALGRVIKVIRTDRGIERRDLAERAEISYSYLTEIENGKKPPSPANLEKIAKALGLRMFELIEAAEGRMEVRDAERAPASAADTFTDRVRSESPSPRLFSNRDYAMQPSLRGSRRDLRAVVIELERLVQVMAPDDIERLLDYARRLAR